MKPEDEIKKEENLNKFFDTKKLYVRFILIVLGIGIVFYMFRKMKQEYVN